MSITMMKLLVTLLASLISLSLPFNKVNAGVMHSHTNELHKERETDGAYSPRDHSHFSEEGEHFSEFDHEAILGSHKEAEDYDHLPPEEAKRRLSILLKKMDINGDEQIDRKELKAWIIRSFKMLSEEEARDRMEDADEDNDNMVTWEEYISDTYGLDSTEKEVKFGDENDKLIQDDKIMWKAADINSDGILDSEEWIAFTHPEEHPNMLPIILGQTLNDYDKDGDGFINFQEYIGNRGETDYGDHLHNIHHFNDEL
nr:calumenin-A [Leptinotarsa decemlineata]XP_023021579.1 calumenin-A [Leptinotarsa decemlineata]